MIEALLAGLFGLLIGSFLNVCIHRMPRDLSVVRPRSYCPACSHPVAWFDNVPLASYVLLRGRCRHCKAEISLRYPLVELLTGTLFALYVIVEGPTPAAARLCLLGALLIGLVFADLESRILPDQFTLGGAAAGLALAPFLAVPDPTAHAMLALAGVAAPEPAASLAEAVLAALLPAGFLWAGGWLFEKLRHKEGLGFGDVKMLAMLGAFLGLRQTLLTLVAGSVLGSVVGLAYIAITRKDAASYELPFGTFLGVAGVLVTLFGNAWVAWYEALL